MAEVVQHFMELMIPELQDLEEKGIFSNDEIKIIAKRRQNFEYSLRRRDQQKIDFLQYIEYEMNLEMLRVKRKMRLGVSGKSTISDFSGTRRIHMIFSRACKRFHGDLDLWIQHAKFSMKAKSSRVAGRVFAKAIQLHPRKPSIWVMAAAWEWEGNADVISSRALLQRAIRLNSDCKSLWVDYFRMELLFLTKILERRQALGVDSNEPKPLGVDSNEPDSLGVEANGSDSLGVEANESESSNQSSVSTFTNDGEELATADEVCLLISNTTSICQLTPVSDSQQPSSPQESFFQGSIPITVIKCALEAIPDADLLNSFYDTYLQQYRRFPILESTLSLGLDFIYSMSQSKFNDSPKSVAIAAKHHLGIMQPHDPSYPSSLKAFSAVFRDQITIAHDPVLASSLILTFAQELLTIFNVLASMKAIGNPNISRYIAETLVDLCGEKLGKSQSCNETLSLEWKNVVEKVFDRVLKRKFVSNEQALELINNRDFPSK